MNLPPFEHLPILINGQPTVHINQLNVIFPTLLALSILWSPYIQHDGIFSDRQKRLLNRAHIHFRKHFWLYYQFQSKTQLPVQLQFQSLSVCIILEGRVFSDVKTLTVEPQWVSVSFVHFHRLSQLTAQ